MILVVLSNLSDSMIFAWIWVFLLSLWIIAPALDVQKTGRGRPDKGTAPTYLRSALCEKWGESN